MDLLGIAMNAERRMPEQERETASFHSFPYVIGNFQNGSPKLGTRMPNSQLTIGKRIVMTEPPGQQAPEPEKREFSE